MVYIYANTTGGLTIDDMISWLVAHREYELDANNAHLWNMFVQNDTVWNGYLDWQRAYYLV